MGFTGDSGAVDSWGENSELDLQIGSRHQSPTDTDEPGGDGGERAGGVELECVEWGDQLQREAGDDERGTVHDDRESDDDELHGHWGDERDDILLRGVGGEHGGGECESSQVSATPQLAVPPPPTNLVATAGNAQVGLSWSASSGATSYNVKRCDDEWGTVHDDRESDDDELHGHWGDERDDVLLRGVGGEHGRGECEFQPGECDAHDEHSRDQFGGGFTELRGLQLNGSTTLNGTRLRLTDGGDLRRVALSILRR